MKRFSQLTQTASEADLVAGNFLAIDIPGVGGVTKKVPGNCVALKSILDNVVQSIAPVFDPDHGGPNNDGNYPAGYSVMYQGQFYKFKVDHSGAWDASHVKKIQLDEILKNFADKIVTEDNELQLKGLPYFMWNKEGLSFSGAGVGDNLFRTLLEFNFKQGVTYRISFALSGYLQKSIPSSSGIFLTTTNDTTTPSTHPVDYITPSNGIRSKDVENKVYNFIFTASANAKNLNIYLDSGDGNWSFVVSIYDCTKYFPDKKLLKEIFTETFENDDTEDGGTKRFYSTFPMKAGAKYFFEVDLSGDFGSAHGLDLFDLNTNSTENTTSVVESVFKIEAAMTHNSGKYVFEFTPTNDTNYIYVYSHRDISKDTLTGTIKVYSVVENGVKPDEGVLIYGIGDSLMVYGWFMEHLRDKYGFKYISYAQGSTGYATNNNDPSKNTYPQRVLTMPNDPPSLVLVEGGTNDFGKNKTIAEVKEAVEDTIENLYTKYPTTPIVGVLPSQRYYSGSAQSPHGMVNDIGINLIEYVDAIKEIYDKYGFPTIDLCRNCGLNELNAPDLTIDGLHWSKDFHKRIAEIIYPVIKKTYVR